jgi:hypothetical protein
VRVRALWYLLGVISTLVAIALGWLADTIDGFRT